MATQHSVIGLDPLAGHAQPELIKPAERIKAWWGSVSHEGPWVADEA